MKKLFKLLLVILLFVAVLRVLLFEGPVLTPTALPQSGIVDIHCHVACLDEKNGCFVADSLRQNFRFPIYLRAMGTSIEALKTKGDDVVAENIHRQIMASQYVSKAIGVYTSLLFLVPKSMSFQEVKYRIKLLQLTDIAV